MRPKLSQMAQLLRESLSPTWDSRNLFDRIKRGYLIKFSDPSQPHPARLTVVTNDLDGIEDYLPPPQRFVVGLPPLAELHEVGMKRRRASRMMMMQQEPNSIENILA